MARDGDLGPGSWGNQQTEGRKRVRGCDKSCGEAGPAAPAAVLTPPARSRQACNVNAITLLVSDVSPGSPLTSTASMCRKLEAK